MKDFLKGLLSRKFLIWVVATVALFLKLIDGYIWGAITGAYLGINLLRHAQEIKNGENLGENLGSNQVCNSSSDNVSSGDAVPPGQ